MENIFLWVQFRSLRGKNLISGNYHQSISSCFHTNTYFLVPHIIFLAKHPVTFFHRFGEVLVYEAKAHWSSFAGNFIVTANLSSPLVRSRIQKFPAWPNF